MPSQTVKNKSGRRIFSTPGSGMYSTQRQNNTRKITYKIPLGLLQPKNILKAKQKNKANTLKALQNEAKKRKEAIARYASRLQDKKLIMEIQPVTLLKAFEDNENTFKPSVTPTAKARGPGSRGTASQRTIPPNLLRMMRGEQPATPPKKAAPSRTLANLVKSMSSGNKTIRKANVLKASKPMGKFWNKNSNSNSNSNSSNNNSD